MLNHRLWIVGISLMLAIHAIAVSRFLPSGFFLVVFFCWSWVGVSAAFNHLDAAKAMSATMAVLSAIAILVTVFFHTREDDLVEYLSLGLAPSMIAWMSSYVLVSHIQRAGDVVARADDDWSKELDEGRDARIEDHATSGLIFIKDMMAGVSQDNSSQPNWPWNVSRSA